MDRQPQQQSFTNSPQSEGKKRNFATTSLSPTPPKSEMFKQARSSYYQVEGQRLPISDIRVNIVELERLLHAMDRQNENGLEETWHSLQFKVDRCYSLWNNIEMALQQQQAEGTVSLERIDNLQNRLLEACEKFTAMITEQQQLEQQQQQTSDNLIHRVFLGRALRQQASSMDLERGSSNKSPDFASDASSETESLDPLADNNIKYASHPVPTRQRGETSSRPRMSSQDAAAVAPNVEDLQRMQREQMEEAISQMTTQLKEETKRIHETLHVQTEGLGRMEDVATENVDKVTQVAKDVQDHVQSSWNRNIGTWTLFFTMVGVFVFMLVMIQMAPKGKGCVFFCPQQPRPDEFCRTLKSGRVECIRMDEEPERKIEDQRHSHESVRVDVSKQTEESCEINTYGECLPTHEDSRAEEADAAAVDKKKRNVRQKEQAEDETFAGSGMVEDNVYAKGKPPKYNRKHFTPRDIRNAANLGDFYLLEGYLSVKPEWVDKVDKNGWNALHLSTRRGDLRAIQLLKRVGADFSIQTMDGRTALDIALVIYEKDHPIIEALTV
eukprot:scaffold1595_cov171-Amphora_coffeaeformis.AAC.9